MSAPLKLVRCPVEGLTGAAVSDAMLAEAEGMPLDRLHAIENGGAVPDRKQVAKGSLKTKLGRKLIEQFLPAAMKVRGGPRHAIVSAKSHSFTGVQAPGRRAGPSSQLYFFLKASLVIKFCVLAGHRFDFGRDGGGGSDLRASSIFSSMLTLS